MTFDYWDIDLLEEEGEYNYKTSLEVVYVCFLIFSIGSTLLFLLFMNFIIAVICDTYQNVKKFSIAHGYKQRVELIYELEVLFKDIDFFD